jgi:hypothetical protein
MQNNYNNKTLDKKDNFLSLNFQNKDLVFVFKKIEKISTAIFILTNFFETNDPLKMSLRNSCTNLLRTILAISHFDLYTRQNSIKQINLNFIELGSYLEIAFYSEIISEMNYNLISQEIVNINQYVQDIIKDEYDLANNTFEKDFFQIKSEAENYYTQYPNKNKFDSQKTNSILDKMSFNQIFKEQNYGIKQKDIIKDNLKEKDKNSIKDRKINTRPAGTEMSFRGSKADFMSFINNSNIDNLNKNISPNIKDKKQENLNKGQIDSSKEIKQKDRRQKIIDEIKVKKQVTIKDLTDKLTGVSEKTIQRELIKMVEQEILVKIGERRWSKYSLKIE